MNSKRSGQKNSGGGSSSRRKRFKQEYAFFSFKKGSRVIYATRLDECI